MHRECRPSSAAPPRLCGDGGTNPRRIRAIVGEPPRERPDQFTVGVEPENLEPGHPTLVEALPVVVDRSFLRCSRSWRNPPYIQ